MRDAERTLIEDFENVIDMFFFKKIDEKSVEEFCDVKENNLFYNIIIQQFR